jgi:hypothetical protein
MKPECDGWASPFPSPGIKTLGKLSPELSIPGYNSMRYHRGMSDEPKLPTASKSLVSEFWDFIVHEKIWWMTPIIVVLLAMVAFILFAEASPVLPFIYAL